MTKTLHTDAFQPCSLPQSVSNTKLVTDVVIISCSRKPIASNSIINNYIPQSNKKKQKEKSE